MEKKQRPNQPSSKPNKPEDKPLTLLQFSGMGFEMLGFVLVGYWVGSQLDDYFETHSILTLIGILLGIAGAMINLFRKLPKS